MAFRVVDAQHSSYMLQIALQDLVGRHGFLRVTEGRTVILVPTN